MPTSFQLTVSASRQFYDWLSRCDGYELVVVSTEDHLSRLQSTFVAGAIGCCSTVCLCIANDVDRAAPFYFPTPEQRAVAKAILDQMHREWIAANQIRFTED